VTGGEILAETSIVIKAEDRYSSVIKSLSAVTKGFSKDAEELERTLRDLSGEKAILKAETDKSRKAMQEAQKQFAATGDAADGLRASLAGQEYEDYRRKLEAINKTMKDTEKQIQSVEGVARKSSTGTSSGIGTLVSALATNGIANMAGQMAQEGANILATSIGGSETGTYFSNVLSSMISAASIGTTLLPGIGTVIGAAAGAGLGIINGTIQNYQSKDEVFKEHYQSLYETVNSNTEERLTSGTTLAASRETDKLSFTTLLRDKGVSADDFLSQVVSTAESTPFGYDELTSLSKTLLSFNYAVEDIIPTLTKVGDAGAALGLASSDIGTVATYLGRMKSSDKATLEYLNPLNERGFAVFQWIADDLKVSIADVYDKISKGDLSGSYVSDLILGKFSELYGGMMEQQSQTTEGLDSTLEDLTDGFAAAAGEAYNKLRNEEKAQEIAAYDGPLGAAMEKLSAVEGENKARSENLQAEYKQLTLSAVLTGDGRDEAKASGLFSQEALDKLEEMRQQYVLAQQAYDQGSAEAGLTMQTLAENAEALGEDLYQSSEWYQKTQEAELEQVESLREASKNFWTSADLIYQASVQFSKGQGINTPRDWTTYDPVVKSDTQQTSTAWPEKSSSKKTLTVNTESPADVESGRSHAYGLKRVPYDGYPAILHQDERVLTAVEARAYDTVPDAGAMPVDGIYPMGSGISMLMLQPLAITWPTKREESPLEGLDVYNSYAYGLKRVPYDGYPAILHQDERVLTAAEARDQKQERSFQVQFTGPITVRQESDLESLARRLADEIESRALLYGG
jgi:hypothetical protein